MLDLARGGIKSINTSRFHTLMWITVQVDAIESSLLQATFNPFLKRTISLIDKECPRDGSLLLNSMRDFSGEPVSLCPTCKSVSTKMAKHFYRLGSSFLHVDMDFMRNQFLNDEFGDAWLRGVWPHDEGCREIWCTHTFHASRTL
jgi:hypothetical protein